MSVEWTPELDDMLRQMRADGMTYWDCAMGLNAHPSSVKRRCAFLKLPTPPRRPRYPPLTDDQRAKIQALVMQNKLALQHIATEIGCPLCQVEQVARPLRKRLRLPRVAPTRVDESGARINMHDLQREPTQPHLVDVPQISDRLALTWDGDLTHEDRVEIGKTIAAATAKLREHYRRQPFRAMA